MVLFFVNGALKIIKNDFLPDDNTIDVYQYKMRFLTENEEGIPKSLKITFKDNYRNELHYNTLINGLEALEFDCTPFIERFNHRMLTHIKIRYTVIIENHNEIIDGSFSLISPIHTDRLNIALTSCNNNQAEDDNNDYEYSRVNYDNRNLWSELNSKNPDIILHVGNQIYGDFIYNRQIGKNDDCTYDHEKIYQAYADLYRTAYRQSDQSTSMRNAINLMIMEGSDIYSSFGNHTKTLKTNPGFTAYYVSGMKAYLNYQYNLHRDIDLNIETEEIDGYESIISACDDFSEIMLGMKNIYYSMDYGKYTIILLDQRNYFYHHGITMDPNQLNWVDNIIANTDNTDILLISPRSIGFLTKNKARLYGYISAEGRDDLLHPNNYNQTLELLHVLNSHKLTKDIKILSGGIRKTFINKIGTLDNLNNVVTITEQLTVGPITRLPFGNETLPKRFVKWILRKVSDFTVGDYLIGRKYEMSNGNSYGFIQDDDLANNPIETIDNLHLSCIKA